MPWKTASTQQGQGQAARNAGYVAAAVAVLAVCAGVWHKGATPASAPGPGETGRQTPIPSAALAALPSSPSEWRVLSEFPRIYVADGFLSHQECDVLRSQVAGRLEPAKVVEKEENKYDQQAKVRNNKQIWLNRTEERDLPEVFHILKRMHRAALIPEDDAEALQIGHYSVEEKYETHQDSDPRSGVARPATMIVYLNDVEEGGETLFPLSHRRECNMRWRRDAEGNQRFGIQNCCDREDLLRISAKKGRAVLFFNHDMGGDRDILAEHAACPVKQGEKWIAQRWFRYQPYQRLIHPLDARFDGLPLVPTGGSRELRVLSQKAPSVYLIEDFLGEEEVQLLLSLLGDARERWVSHEETRSSVLNAVVKRMHQAVRLPETAASLRLRAPGTREIRDLSRKRNRFDPSDGGPPDLDDT
ncbi:unnamed protein product [Effrenium voratum]|uniref:Fe2OG dioxygenase domain-containing protein n=1 Tax=Effrenium voratum TaxID=2562239 RepID=A0AA36HMC0_9DINO|nr:unnamed protein product [Effrenium voratum]